MINSHPINLGFNFALFKITMTCFNKFSFFYTNVFFQLISTFFLMTQPQFAFAGGGGEVGGGEGVEFNGKIITVDHYKCKTWKKNDNKDLQLNIKNNSLYTTKKINILSSQVISDFLNQSTSLNNIKNKNVKNIILGAANNTMWLLLKNFDLNLDPKRLETSFNLAIYYRSVGVILNADKIQKMSTSDQIALFLHESMRMISIGFGLNFSTEEIEEYTCGFMSSNDTANEAAADLWNKIENKFSHPFLESTIQKIAEPHYLYNYLESSYDRNLVFSQLASSNILILFNMMYKTEFCLRQKNECDDIIDNTWLPQLLKTIPTQCGLLGNSSKLAIGNAIRNCNYSELWLNPINEIQMKSILVGANENATIWQFYEDAPLIAYSKSKKMKPSEGIMFCDKISHDLGKKMILPNESDLRNLKRILNTAFLTLNKTKEMYISFKPTSFLGMNDNDVPFIFLNESYDSLIIMDNIPNSDIDGRALCIEEENRFKY